MLPVFFDGYRRVSKPAARKMFIAGKQVWVTTNDANLSSEWTQPIELTPALEQERTASTFDRFVNSFIYYNCDGKKRYPMFVVKEDA